MMIETLVDQNARLIRFTVSGTVETTEMLAALDDALRQLEPGRPYDVLSDHRELVRAVTPEQIRALMGALSVGGQAIQGGRCGVVVSTDASYGMMRLMAVHAEAVGIKVGVFRKLEEAVAFIAEAPRTPSAAP
jgi:hypothetical protein